MNLTPHFTLKEFACHDGSLVPAHYLSNLLRLARQLERVREDIGQPLHIVSGYRSPDYNARVGGARHSQHLIAMAADVRAAKLTTRQLHAVFVRLIEAGAIQDGGLGLYSNWVHYDVGPAGRRW